MGTGHALLVAVETDGQPDEVAEQVREVLAAAGLPVLRLEHLTASSPDPANPWPVS